MNGAELIETLEARADLWAYWGFEPWRSGSLRGVFRRQHFVKDGFLGKIAEYGAWDYIVWRAGGEAERQTLWNTVRPVAEIMTQRFLFVLPEPWPGRRVKSFWLGFKGYVEFFAYWPLAGPAAKEVPPDLSGLVDLALKPPRAGPE